MTKNQPTVSVIMPCYNNASSLPWALASLLAQTFHDWELIFVDDGSSDASERVVAQVNDPRIRSFVLPRNFGRGYARNRALQEARGEYICMLDADDWMLPTRIETQFAALIKEPQLTLVSTGMSIVDAGNNLVGVRSTGAGTIVGPYRSLVLPVAFPASMFRRSHLGDTSFDPHMRTTEDVDFTVNLLQGRYYTVLPFAPYVYSELASASASKAAEGQRLVRRHARRYWKRYPAQFARLAGSSTVKEVIYRIAAAIQLDDQIIGARSRRPTEREQSDFAAAQDTVLKLVETTFGLLTASEPGPFE